MAVLVSDSFNRANNTTTLGTTDSINGGTAYTWGIYNGGVWGISSNQAYTPTSHADNTAYVDIGQSDNVTINLTLGNANVITYGIAFRIQDANNFFRAYATGGILKIDRKTAGTWTNIGSLTGSYTFPMSASITLSGSTITFNIGGVAKLSVTDSSFQTATAHGMYINSSTSVFLDNFEIDGTAAGGTTVTSIAATATNSAVAPSISGEASISATTAASTMSGIAPSVSADANVTAIAATATASANAPFVGQVTQISAVVATVSAQAIAPNVTAQQNAVIVSVVASSIASMLAAYPNVTKIIGTIKLKGERTLTISLKASRQLTFKLKGGLPMAKEQQNFTMYAGDSETLEFTVTDANTKLPVNLGGASIKWAMKKGLNGEQVLYKTTASGITITDAGNGVFTVTLQASDTTAVNAGGYYHESEVTDSLGNVSTVATGSAQIKASGI